MLALEHHKAQQRHANWLPVYPGRKGGFSFQHRIPAFINMNYLTTVLKSLHPRIDDDFVDRMNYYYTSSSMVVFAILVSAKQYVGHPIECWVPAQFTKGMEQYTENYCWVQNTYWVPFSDLIPSRINDRERRQIGYYQWVPFILAIQALMFYIPCTVWRLLNSQSGINIHGILEMANDEHNIEPENRSRTVNILSRHIDDALRHQRDYGCKNRALYLWSFIRLGKFYGAYVSTLYGFAKLLYLVNVLGQFFLLNRFLETDDYRFFGAHVFWDLIHGREWINSGKFPRVTLCDFEIRVLGNIHRHTVQCVLVINMFTEKIFVFLWFWFLFLSLGTLASLLFWVITLVVPGCRIRIIAKYLELTDHPIDPEKDEQILRRFTIHFLRPDGVFILRMISLHAGTIIAAEIADSLWQKFHLNVTKSPSLYGTPEKHSPKLFPHASGSRERVDRSANTERPDPIPPLRPGGHREAEMMTASPDDSMEMLQQSQEQLNFSSPTVPLIGNHKPSGGGGGTPSKSTGSGPGSRVSPLSPPLSAIRRSPLLGRLGGKRKDSGGSNIRETSFTNPEASDAEEGGFPETTIVSV